MAPKRSTYIRFCLLCWLIAASASILWSQGDTIRFERKTSLPGQYRFFATDKLQQVYAVTSENAVIKYDARGREQFRYNNNTLGTLALLDATNPFSLLLYYPDFLTALTLDRTLSETGDFILSDLDILLPSRIALGNDNHIWVYDEADFQLKKIDQERQIVAKSDNLAFLLGKTPRPTGMVSRENAVFLNDPEMGILVFDNFGQYIKTLPITGVNHFQILENKLIYQRENYCYIFDLQSLLTNKLELPAAISQSAQLEIQKNRLYVLTGSGIDIYTFGQEE